MRRLQLDLERHAAGVPCGCTARRSSSATSAAAAGMASASCGVSSAADSRAPEMPEQDHGQLAAGDRFDVARPAADVHGGRHRVGDHQRRQPRLHQRRPRCRGEGQAAPADRVEPPALESQQHDRGHLPRPGRAVGVVIEVVVHHQHADRVGGDGHRREHRLQPDVAALEHGRSGHAQPQAAEGHGLAGERPVGDPHRRQRVEHGPGHARQPERQHHGAAGGHQRQPQHGGGDQGDHEQTMSAPAASAGRPKAPCFHPRSRAASRGGRCRSANPRSHSPCEPAHPGSARPASPLPGSTSRAECRHAPPAPCPE